LQMFKSILKMVALSATLTLLSACGASEFIRCSGFGLGDKAFDRPSCDSFTGGGVYELSGFKAQTIGGPIVDEKGTATYDGMFGLYGSDARGGGVRLTVNFDEKKITNDNSIHRTSVIINGEFTERGVLTGKFNVENDGTAPADINGLIGYDGVWATFDNRSETADGYLGGFMATRLDYPQPDACAYCTSGLSPQEIVELEALIAETARIDAEYERLATIRIERDRIAEQEYLATIERDRIAEQEYLAELDRLAKIESDRLAKEEQDRLRNIELWLAQYKPTTTAVQIISVNVVPSPIPARNNDRYRQISNEGSTRAQDTFSVIAGTNDSIIMTVNGVDYSLVLSSHGSLDYGIDPNVEWSDTKNYTSLVGHTWRDADYLNDVTRGIHPTIQGDFVQYTTRTVANSYYDETGDNPGYTKGMATIGIPTLASVVDAQTAVATYWGEAILNIHDGYRLGYYFDGFNITMNVDFDANTIAGTGNNRALDRSEKTSGKLIFNSTPIDGHGFEGTFTFERGLRAWYELTDNPTGQYSGNFFGPNADDVAGVMSFEGTARRVNHGYTTDVNIIGFGGFRADRIVSSY
ncbi:MAG: transferrin-binding protein-like solute binding protein, partial [Proteobacteria bacterium]|nr:transferrin-binding protein-like solute binding protein [Pseudomonadota bacterium]